MENTLARVFHKAVFSGYTSTIDVVTATSTSCPIQFSFHVGRCGDRECLWRIFDVLPTVVAGAMGNGHLGVRGQSELTGR